MWLKFIKDCETNRDKDVVWTDDNTSAQEQINSGNAVRCLGPDGEIFEDSTPEAVITQLAAEKGISYEEEERFINQNRKKWSNEKKEKASLGNYLDESEI
jgi:uncharacterized protein YaiI (UPF0178 family)